MFARYTIVPALCMAIWLASCSWLSAQHVLKPSDSLQKKRVWIVGGTWTALYGTALIGLNAAWYADFERGPFQFYDDSREWLQMDKAGHLFTNYFEAKWTADALKWAGVKQRKAALIGTATGLVFQTTLETLDGFSAEWGFSPADMTANAGGALLFLSQELLWNEQRVQVKFSTSPSIASNYSSYCNCDINARQRDLYGASVPEQILKNYNHQTYWLSVNMHSFFLESNIPAWLNVAFGYGAQGMLGGYENEWFDNGKLISATDVNRVRQFYISPDIDLTKIKTNKPLLKTLFSVLNIVKVPMPALMLNSRNQITFYPLFF